MNDVQRGIEAAEALARRISDGATKFISAMDKMHTLAHQFADKVDAVVVALEDEIEKMKESQAEPDAPVVTREEKIQLIQKYMDEVGSTNTVWHSAPDGIREEVVNRAYNYVVDMNARREQQRRYGENESAW